MPTSPIRNILKLKEAIRPEQLPAQVPRSLAALFALCHRMTLIRAEKDGYLVPIRRGMSRNVYYDKSNSFAGWGLTLAIPTTGAGLAARAKQQREDIERRLEDLPTPVALKVTEDSVQMRRVPQTWHRRMAHAAERTTSLYVGPARKHALVRMVLLRQLFKRQGPSFDGPSKFNRQR